MEEVRFDIRAADLLPAVRPPVAADSPPPGPEAGIPATAPEVAASEPERPYAARSIKVLSADAEAAAILEAWGASRAEIADRFNVSVGTVSVWRRSKVYIERRAKETKIVVADAKNRMQRARQKSFDVREKMYDRLDTMLDATDENGHMQVGSVVEASKLIIADKAVNSEFTETVEVNTTVHGSIFHVVDGEVRTGSGDVVDGEAVEEAELEPGS